MPIYRLVIWSQLLFAPTYVLVSVRDDKLVVNVEVTTLGKLTKLGEPI